MKYIHAVRRVFSLLGVRLRHGLLMVALLVLYAGLEGFGVGLLLPVLEFVESGGGAAPQGGIWTFVNAACAWLGLPVSLGTLLVFSFVPIIARQAVLYASTVYTSSVQNRAVERLTARCFHALTVADVSWIDSQDQGRLISFVLGQVARCGDALVLLLKLVGGVIIIVVYSSILMIFSWPLALVSTIALAGISLAMRGILQRSRRYGADLTEETNVIIAAVRERLLALRLIKLRGRETEETERIREIATRQRDARVRITTAAALVEVVVDPALMLSAFLIIYVGVEFFGMSLATLGVFLFVLLRINGKARDLNLNRQAFTSQMPAFDYVESTLESALASRTIEGGDRPFVGLTNGIEFSDVRFRYGAVGDDEEVLRGVTLRLPKGSLTAIVGRSGSGKTTLVDMIPRLKVPSSGEIRVDGSPIEEFELLSLRRSVGMLTQEPLLFNDTIRNNLAFGLDHEPTDEQLREALESSHASFVYQLPLALETVLGDRGVRFSGGQRQRLALARVFLQDPDILVLDEPTSALDSESERYIQLAFERVAQDRTVVVVAHRLATVKHADQILVLSGGRIVESGTHQELMDSGEHYRQLFSTQMDGGPVVA